MKKPKPINEETIARSEKKCREIEERLRELEEAEFKAESEFRAEMPFNEDSYMALKTATKIGWVVLLVWAIACYVLKINGL